MHTLENDKLLIEIADKGAELQRIYHKETQLEYLWNGDRAFWNRHSPVLFPIVGGLKGGKYTYKGNHYTLGRHGFARDKDFSLSHRSENSLSFTLNDDADSRAHYPFHFRLSITFTLKDNDIHIGYLVENRGSDIMWFSIGAHPAFRVPLTEDTVFEDYYLSFNEFENTARYPLDDAGQLKEDPQIFLQNTDELPLQKSLFYEDALVFKTLQSTTIEIKSNKTPHGVAVDFEGFPYMGIWNAKDADFVCIEPWHGIADSEKASGNLEEKEGILSLKPDAEFQAGWGIRVF